jgi:membrane fusion protein, multidrug efflux system
MKATKTLLIYSFTLLLISCGKKEDNSLAGKKAKLAEFQKQAQTLTTDIKTLQSEIAKLEPNKEEKVKEIAVSPLTMQTFKHFVEVNGSLDAENNVFVSPKMGGALTNVSVKEGDYVKQGQVIAKIDNSVLQTSMQEIQVQLETAKTLFERQKALWDQKIGTEVQFIQAKTGVEALEKRMATIRSQDAMNLVTSPISGYVDEVRQKSGEMAMPGLGILRVVNLNNLKVVAKVPDAYAGTVKKGDMVTVKFPDLENKEVTAKLTFVSQTVNPVTRTFLVEAIIPNSGNLKPNLNAVVTINDQSKGSAVVIEQNLIQRTEEGDLVYVAVQEGSKKIARSRKVKTGLSYNGQVEIIEGLSAGDLLITTGYQELVDGQAVSY